MRRSFVQVMKDAWEILKEDIRNYGLAIMIIVVLLGLTVGRIYSTCPLLMITGFPCPGCGLTRAGTALLNLNFARAFELHPMIYPIAALAAVFVLYRYFFRKSTKPLLKYVIMILVMMGILYVYRMVKYFPDKRADDLLFRRGVPVFEIICSFFAGNMVNS